MNVTREDLLKAKECLEAEIISLKEEIKKLECELEQKNRELFALTFAKQNIERWLGMEKWLGVERDG